jgi:hypothetical protein
VSIDASDAGELSSALPARGLDSLMVASKFGERARVISQKKMIRQVHLEMAALRGLASRLLL